MSSESVHFMLSNLRLIVFDILREPETQELLQDLERHRMRHAATGSIYAAVKEEAGCPVQGASLFQKTGNQLRAEQEGRPGLNAYEAAAAALRTAQTVSAGLTKENAQLRLLNNSLLRDFKAAQQSKLDADIERSAVYATNLALKRELKLVRETLASYIEMEKELRAERDMLAAQIRG